MKTKYDTLAAVLFLKFIAAENGERPDLSLAVRSMPGQPDGENTFKSAFNPTVGVQLIVAMKSGSSKNLA